MELSVKLGESLTVKDVPVDDIVIGKSQARASDLEKGIEDLMSSMDRWGLLEPITVYLNDNRKYEILAGQRRFTSAKKLGWKTISAVIRSKPKDEFEAKAISLTENVTTNPMTTQDIMDACEMLFKRYNNTKMVAKVIGISDTFVKKYVKYARLPDSVRQAVDKGQLGDATKAISIALKATDALQYEPEGSVSEQKVLDLAKILAKKIPQEQNEIVEEAKKDPEREVTAIVEKASEPKKKSKGKELELVMDDDNFSRLESYQQKNKNTSPEDAALDLIADGLDRAGV